MRRRSVIHIELRFWQDTVIRYLGRVRGAERRLSVMPSSLGYGCNSFRVLTASVLFVSFPYEHQPNENLYDSSRMSRRRHRGVRYLQSTAGFVAIAPSGSYRSIRHSVTESILHGLLAGV